MCAVLIDRGGLAVESAKSARELGSRGRWTHRGELRGEVESADTALAVHFGLNAAPNECGRDKPEIAKLRSSPPPIPRGFFRERRSSSPQLLHPRSASPRRAAMTRFPPKSILLKSANSRLMRTGFALTVSSLAHAPIRDAWSPKLSSSHAWTTINFATAALVDPRVSSCDRSYSPQRTLTLIRP